jgi:hypothetical protein
MRWIFLGILAATIAVLGLSVPDPIVSTAAYAGKMNGKPGGGRNDANYGPSKYEMAAKSAKRHSGMKKH